MTCGRQRFRVKPAHSRTRHRGVIAHSVGGGPRIARPHRTQRTRQRSPVIGRQAASGATATHKDRLSASILVRARSWSSSLQQPVPVAVQICRRLDCRAARRTGDSNAHQRTMNQVRQARTSSCHPSRSQAVPRSHRACIDPSRQQVHPTVVLVPYEADLRSGGILCPGSVGRQKHNPKCENHSHVCPTPRSAAVITAMSRSPSNSVEAFRRARGSRGGGPSGFARRLAHRTRRDRHPP